MFANWEIITHINQTLHAHVLPVYLPCVSKDTAYKLWGLNHCSSQSCDACGAKERDQINSAL